MSEPLQTDVLMNCDQDLLASPVISGCTVHCTKAGIFRLYDVLSAQCLEEIL